MPINNQIIIWCKHAVGLYQINSIKVAKSHFVWNTKMSFVANKRRFGKSIPLGPKIYLNSFFIFYLFTQKYSNQINVSV